MTKTLTSHAAAAKAIRKELKAAFPNEPMSVRSESFAGGNAVTIRIGKRGNEVFAEASKMVKKYQYGSFDGMTDSYDYTNRRDDIPQVKYVSVESYR